MLDQLKKDFPGMSEEVLQQVAEEEGLDTSPVTIEQEEDETTPDEVEEVVEEEQEEPDEQEEQEETEPAEQEKKVPLKALHEERNKRKALAAQIEAMKAEIESIKNKPVQQQPVQPIKEQQDISEIIEKQAEKEVRERLNFNGDLDILQYDDPAMYRKITKEIAKAEFRIESEVNNRQQIQAEVNKALQEFNSQPDFREVDIYAEQTLNDLPLREARSIQNAIDSLNRGTINKDQVSLLKDFYVKCQTEYRQSINPNKSPQQKSPVNKIAEMAKMPRASQLSGSNGSRSLSTAELESMLDQGRFNELPPEVIKKYMR